MITLSPFTTKKRIRPFVIVIKEIRHGDIKSLEGVNY
uniref:Uncharacterized protein n=1 Tax=marine sediment metagenome TaxID=412755 RepID=A0A1B6NRQ9_9ZZZZ